MPSTDDLLDLRGIAQRQAWFRFDVLDATLSVIGTVQPDGDPTITVDTSRSIMRSMAGFTLAPDEGEDFQELGTFIRPVMVLENGDEGALGTFRFVDARRIRSDLGLAFEGTMADLAVQVDVQSTQTYAVGAGSLIEAKIRAILGDRGILAMSIQGTGTRTGQPIAWPAGTSWLRIVNELSAMMGCLPLYFEADGTARVRTAPDFATALPSVTYEDGLNILETGIAESNDLLTAPNMFVVIDSGANSAPIRGVYSLPPSAPNSAYHIGFDNPLVLNEQGLANTAAANARAQVASLTEGTVFERVAFDSAPDWRHGVFDVVSFRGDLYMENSWSLTCAEGSNMGHQLSKAYS